MLFKQIERLKHRLSHIREDAWHWKVSKTIFGQKAYGKACTYYWFKLPLALLAFGFMLLIGLIWLIARCLIWAIAWFFGFRFYGNILDFDDEMIGGFKWNDYKTLNNNKKVLVAPWEIIVPIVLLALGLSYPSHALAVLFFLGLALLVSLFLYVITKAWKIASVATARESVTNVISSGWNEVCPDLVVGRAPLPAGKPVVLPGPENADDLE